MNIKQYLRYFWDCDNSKSVLKTVQRIYLVERASVVNEETPYASRWHCNNCRGNTCRHVRRAKQYEAITTTYQISLILLALGIALLLLR